MILARISAAIRAQNWFAVVLEFVIVIAGVVIGFQVTEWAAARETAERRAVTLDRLHDEVEDAVGILQWMVGNYEELNSNRTAVIERLLARDLNGIDTEANRTAAVAMTLFPAFSPRQGVYTEIVSSGMLSSLGDEDFRAALGDYQSGIVFLQGQIDYFRTLTTRRTRITDFDFVYLEYVPGSNRERRHVVEWAAAADDPEFLQFMLEGNNSMRAMSSWWANTLESAETLCAETARLTGRNCEPPEAPFE